MNLEQTIKQMREKNEDDAKFYPLIESMKRRANKGLLEGVKPEDIDFVINKIENEKIIDEDHINLNQELFELNEAISDYENLDKYSEEEVEQIIYEGFIGELNNLLLERDADPDGTSEKIGRKLGAATAITGGALTAQHAYKMGAKHGWWPSLSAKLKAAQAAGSSAGIKAAGMGAGYSSGAGAATGGFLSKFVGGVSGAASAAPIATAAAAVGGGLALGAGIYGAVKLIKWLRKKRRERQRSSFELQEFLFTPEFDSSFAYIVNNLTNEEIAILKEKACEDTIEIINMFRGRGETLNEAVTFIDNAGNLKTMLTPDYVKDMHCYNTDTEIAKYKKKKKIINYKLISEEVDINNIKPLSEMSLEDILNEELI